MSRNQQARMVNSQTLRLGRGEQGIRVNRHGPEMQAATPGQVRRIMKQDAKDSRIQYINSSNDRGRALNQWAVDTRGDRRTACGRRTGDVSVWHRSSGSRDANSNVLGACYKGRYGKRVNNK
jgi:ABC-type phosphate transport system substrate-binding protein